MGGILAVVVGYVAGMYMPTNLNILINVGMIMMAFLPINTIGGVLVISGYLVATFLRANLIDDLRNHGYRVAKANLMTTVAGYGMGILAFIGIETIKATNTVFMAFSFIQILMLLFQYFSQLEKKGTIRSILGLIILGILAHICLSSIGKLGVYAFFFAISIIPNIVLDKQKKENNYRQQERNKSNNPLVAFTYGISHNSPLISGLVLAQTILWGSAKDTLGSIINIGISSAVLGPIRPYWAVLLLIVMIVSLYFFLEMLNYFFDNHTFYGKKKESFMESFVLFIFAAIGLLLILAQFGLFLTLLILFYGILINLLLPFYAVKQFGTPTLLVIGVNFI